MSYEHCEQHDEDATNGCPRCKAASAYEDAADYGSVMSDYDLWYHSAGGLARRIVRAIRASEVPGSASDAVQLMLAELGGEEQKEGNATSTTT